MLERPAARILSYLHRGSMMATRPSPNHPLEGPLIQGLRQTLMIAASWWLAGSAAAQPTAFIKVTVVAGTTAGAPVGGASVSLSGTGLGGITNPSGVVLITVPSPGSYQVRATSLGFCVTGPVTAVTVPGATTSLVIPLCPSLPTPVLVGLLITPKTVTLLPGGTQQFLATGMWSDGSTTAPSAIWTATGGTITTSGLYAAGAATGTFRVIAVKAGDQISDTAQVTIGSGGGTPPIDQVTLQNEPTTKAVVAFDAATGTDCLEDRIATGVHVVSLGANAHPPGTTSGSGQVCHTAVAIFSPNHGFFYSNDPAVLTWTTSADDLPVALPSRLRVPVTVWVANAGGGSLATLLSQIKYTHLARAADLFTKSGAGLELVADATTAGAPQVIDVTTLAAAAVLRDPNTSGCDFATQIRANPAIYHIDHLNVYYVKTIPGLGANSTGYNCYVNGAQDIMFLRSDAGLPHLLAHEIGHALGLLEPTWGHTHDLAGFALQPDGSTPRNFMAYEASELPNPYYISHGQMFRINLSARSWLNIPGSSAKSPREVAAGAATPFVTDGCPCQSDETAPDCPSLPFTNLSSVPLSPAPVYALACKAIPTLATITVCVGAKQIVRANYFADPGGLVPARSTDHFWRSDDPTIAEVVETNSGFYAPIGGGWSEGTITGRAAGKVVTVKVYLGGPSAMAVVTVTTCP